MNSANSQNQLLGLEDACALMMTDLHSVIIEPSHSQLGTASDAGRRIAVIGVGYK